MSTVVTLAVVNPLISTHSLDRGEKDEFSCRLDNSTNKWRMLSLAMRLDECNDVICPKLLNDGDKVNFNAHGDSSLEHHGKCGLQLLFPLSTLRSRLPARSP